MVEPFEVGSAIFKDENVLQPHYVPDDLVGREEELQKYRSYLQPVMNNASPANILLLGKSGVGKTAATKSLLPVLKSSYENKNKDTLTTLWVNCENTSSSYQVAIDFVNQLRDPENTISTTGYPSNQVISFLREEVNKKGGVFIFVLDEVDHLTDDSILYELSRSKADGHIPNAKIGVIGISNSLDYRDTLSGKVKSSLSEEQLRFDAYNAVELRAVLEDRVERGLKEEAISDEVVPLCAAYGAKDGGDARDAIKLLYKSAKLAREYGDKEVTEEHAREARKQLEEDQVVEGIQELTTHEQLVLYALITLEAEDETPVVSSKLYDRYAILTPDGEDERTHRRVRDFLGVLADLRLITIKDENQGRRGGIKRMVMLNKPVTELLKGLGPLINDVGVHKSIKNKYKSIK